jgi:hypothetical protein
MAPITTPVSATAWSPDVTTHEPIQVLPEAAILELSTVAGRIEGDQPSVRVAIITDDQASVEGAPVPEAAPELSEALVFTCAVTQLLRVSNEQMAQPSTPAQLAASVARALTRKSNDLFFNAPTPTPPSRSPSSASPPAASAQRPSTS